MNIVLRDTAFTLLPEKALYKPDEKLLIIADVHLGKARHFRKGGVSIPAQAQEGDYDNLRALFNKVKPQKVYFLGDLFHSELNNDWHDFTALVQEYHHIGFTLVRGNHDIIDHDLFHDLGVLVVDAIGDDRFVYSHEPLEAVPEGKLNFAGHIHPGFVLSGIARQSIKLPCFYSSAELCILPAFGVLTGLYSMDRTKSTDIYIILPDSVRKI